MKWMEIIHLRSIKELRPELIQELNRPSPEFMQNGDEIRQSVYQHHRIENEYCILLQYSAEASIALPGTRGLQLANALKEFGSLNHMVWIETDNK